MDQASNYHSPECEATIAWLVNRITLCFAPDRIILFGSSARGDRKSGSDIDLLVLFSELGDPQVRASDLYRACESCGVPKDIVVSTTARFERYRNVVNTVYWPAAREGRTLYQRGT